MSHKRIYRQGDVLLLEAELPEGNVREVARTGTGTLVVGSGEVTGHHTIAEPDAFLLESADTTRYLWVDSPMHLRHDEHLPIIIQPGVFKIVIQREYVLRWSTSTSIHYQSVAD